MATQEQIDNLKRRISETRSTIEVYKRDLKEIENERLDTNIALRAAENAENEAEVTRLKAKARELRQEDRQVQEEIQKLEEQLGGLGAQLATAEEALKPPAPEKVPPATASQAAQDDAPKGPTAAPEQQVGPNGRVVTPENTGPTNAAVQPTGDNPAGTETGTNAPVKPTEQTQAINTDSNSGQPPVAPATDQSAAETARLASKNSATTKPGVAAAKDDNTPARTVQNTVDAGDNADLKIVPQPNVLDDYYSYTYTASVYLLTETQYARLQNSKNKTVDGYYLLFQSGGAPNNVGDVRPPPAVAVTPSRNSRDAQRQASERQAGITNGVPTEASYTGPDGGRNPFFPDDFYIDSITIKSVIAGKATGSAHNVAEMKFTVVEPNGITLLDNLYKAVQNVAPKDAAGKVNYTAATYLMVLRFYGYDQDGTLVQVAAKVDAEGTSDRTAVVEKFIPFKIANLNWSVGSRLVSYEWECVPPGMMIAGGTIRGTIPVDVQLTNSTVGGLLGNNRVTVANSSGDENQSSAETARLARQNTALAQKQGGRLSDSERATQNYNNSNEFAGMQEQNTTPAASAAPSTPAPAPAKANSAPSNKVILGLMAAMNEQQQSLVKRGIYTTADVYSIEFVGPGAKAISGAKLQLPNAKVDKKQTASGGSPAKEGGKALDQRAQAVDMISRSVSITAGQQLLQVIEQVIRNSSYITDQALVVLNPDGTYTANPKANPNKPMKWFEISMSATAIGDKIDPLRNDYAYNIKYVVRQKIIPNFDSKYFPVSTFTGIHKSYPYWFTGQNTAVLEYQETLNALYHVTVSGDAKVGEDRTNREQFTSSLADVRKYAYSPRSNASSHGASGKEFELGANAVEVIYSPGDLAEAKVKIIGDPAWIQQGSLFRDAEQIIATSTGFDPDGSISFDSTMPMFEVVWQRPQDYNIDTGLADPYSVQPGEYKRSPQQSRVYVAHTVTSEFTKGSFTQLLEGALYLFPIPGKNAPVVKPKTSDATRRNPNITKEVAERTKVDLSEDAGRAARQRYAATDPRLTTGGRAAVAGGQRQAGAPAPTFGDTPGGAATGNPKIAAQGKYGGATQVLPAGAPRPATSGSGAGGPSGTTGAPLTAPNAGSAPQRLPASPNTVTPSNVAAARRGESNRSPTSPTNPSNQPIVKTT
jgi:hypothetical protein